MHAPTTIEGHACWSAGTACAEVSMTGLTLDTAGALAASREMGATGWAAAELLLALRIGMAEGQAAQQETVPPGNERDPVTPRAS